MLDQYHIEVRRVASSIVLLLILFIWNGCSSSSETTEGKSRSQTVLEEGSSAPLHVFEQTLNPSDFDEDVEVVLKTQKETETETKVNVGQDSTIVEEEVAQGFRIQIFATSNIDEANAIRAAALQKMADDSIYVVFDAPVYKIRVGDFPTRLEANRKLAALIEKGFSDAWVVADRIVQRKIIRVPRVEGNRRNE